MARYYTKYKVEGLDIGNLIGQSTWMSSNFVNISLKNRGQAF